MSFIFLCTKSRRLNSYIENIKILEFEKALEIIRFPFLLSKDFQRQDAIPAEVENQILPKGRMLLRLPSAS